MGGSGQPAGEPRGRRRRQPGMHQWRRGREAPAAKGRGAAAAARGHTPRAEARADVQRGGGVDGAERDGGGSRSATQRTTMGGVSGGDQPPIKFPRHKRRLGVRNVKENKLVASYVPVPRGPSRASCLLLFKKRVGLLSQVQRGEESPQGHAHAHHAGCDRRPMRHAIDGQCVPRRPHARHDPTPRAGKRHPPTFTPLPSFPTVRLRWYTPAAGRA